MIEFLKTRRSIRAFTEEPVSREDIDNLLKAALLAPSGMGKKSTECIVVQDKATIARLKTCKKSGTTPLTTAPLAIVLIGNREKSDTWVEDAAIAATLIQLEVVKLGLGSTWVHFRLRESVEGPSEESVRNVLNIPEKYGVLNVIAIGHKAEEKASYTDADLDFSRIHSEHF